MNKIEKKEKDKEKEKKVDKSKEVEKPKVVKKKTKKNISTGIAFVNATFNNTIVSIADNS